MTEDRATQVANVLIGVAAVGAAFYVLKTPSLRRMLWGLTRTALAGSGPAWLLSEARRGWDESGDPSSRQPAI